MLEYYSLLKTSGYAGVVFIFTTLDLPELQISILLWLMCIDTFTWVVKQLTVDPTEITSWKFKRWLLQKLMTLIVIVTMSLLLKSAIWEYSTMTMSWLISLFICAEWYSILWNAAAVSMWKEIKEYDAVSLIFKTVHTGIWEAIEKMIEKITGNKTK